MRIHGHLRGAKNEAAMVRSSLGLLYLFAAVPINPSTNSVRLSIICERNRSGCAAKPRRTAYDLHRHFEPTQAKTDVSACAWIAVDTKTVLEWRNQIRRASPCSVSGARIGILMASTACPIRASSLRSRRTLFVSARLARFRGLLTSALAPSRGGACDQAIIQS